MKASELKPVRFRCHAPEAGEVFIAGSFNDWESREHLMTRSPLGEWRICLSVTPGRHEFKFIVDGEWTCGPGYEEERRGRLMCVPNGWGTMNRIVEVEP